MKDCFYEIKLNLANLILKNTVSRHSQRNGQCGSNHSILVPEKETSNYTKKYPDNRFLSLDL
jgi:hypothetical protein